MRNLIPAVFFLSTILLQAQNEGNSSKVEPSLLVAKAFEKDFPKITPVWREEYTGDNRDKLSYEADFTLKNVSMTAVYDALGVFQVLQIELKPSEIPQNVSRYMMENYPKNDIKKAAKLMTNDNKVTYEIGITINEKWEIAVFDKEGDFLKMVPKG